MGEVCVDFLDSYRKFFDRFILSVDPTDQLPVKVAGYNLIESEIAGAVADWSLQYLEQRKCPPSLIAHLVRKVVEEVRILSKIDPITCGYRGEFGDFLSLKLMQACINKVVEVCSRYQDNAELSSLPPPHPMPPVTTCAIKNSRRSMEDRHVVIHDFHSLFNIKGHGPASYYGVFDGHNGTDAAIYSVSHLHQYVAESPHYPNNPVMALRDACTKTDDLFTIKAERENLHGGTTAVFALLRPKERKLYVAWLGDSQAVLVRQGIPLQIVRPHKPDRSDERDRIEGMGGTVLYWGAWRVNGQLAVSRAIGDVEYKPYVTAIPDVEEITLDGTEDFLILACDGLWDFVTELEATNAVYKQLQENPEDLEAVSHRLVALSKEQSSQDNISVVVVFLANPSEVAKRRLMETASPSPFVSQNGSDLYCGGPANGKHRTPPFEDDEDFGPETDVDMVDDVLLSPAIAAAKALVHGKHGAEDDLERQRQQLSDFDDPADIDRSRDTPTPPAHEVASNANVDNLAESGGEESEEEWNYIPGKDTKPEPDADIQEQDDMSSQLNPNAAEFVPVSPTRLLMLDDAIISASPRLGFETSLDNIQVPSELEFSNEIAQRPGDLELTNGPKHDDYFMRDNFSTLRNKGKDFNVSTCAELGDDSIASLSSVVNSSTACPSEDIPFDKLEAVQNMEEKVTSCVLENVNLLGTHNEISNEACGATNIFDNHDLMTTSVGGLKDLAHSPEPEDNIIPGTPKSTVVEAPLSPSNDDVLPLNLQADLDSPADDYMINAQKSPELISPGDGPLDGVTSGQERTSSSGFESESGAEEGETNVPEESNEGFVTEHRKSPPIDLSFKPIQNFSDTNPFSALQTPSTTTPLDQFDVHTEVKVEHSKQELVTPIKEKLEFDNSAFLQSTPSSFISLRRSPAEEKQNEFDNLESPKDIIEFLPPPNANSSLLASEMPQSPEHQNTFEDILKSLKQEPSESNLESESIESNVGVNDSTLNPFSEDKKAEFEETSFTTEIGLQDVQETVSTISHTDLDTTEGFLVEESKILQDEQECEQISKLSEDITVGTSELPQVTDNNLLCSDVSLEAVDKVLAVYDEIKDDHEIESQPEPHEEGKLSDSEFETKEMKLEFESHIADSKTTPDELKNLDDGFEIITREEVALAKDINSENELKEVELSIIPDKLNESEPSLPDVQPVNIEESTLSQENELLSPSTQQTNPFVIEQNLSSANGLESDDSKDSVPVTVTSEPIDNKLSSAIDNFNTALEEDLVKLEQLTLLSSEPELSSPLEPAATKTVSYQTLTPADEPKITKTASYVTGIEEEVPDKSPVPEDSVLEVTKAEESPAVEKEVVVEVASAPIEATTLIVEEPVLPKSDPVQSQVVTETLITALEEISEVPSMATTEVPSSAGTPPPTPAPGLEDKEDSQKTDILVAAVAAAGAVAAGGAIIAEKKAASTAKKPTSTATKKPDPAAKVPAKAAPVKATTKPATTKPTTTTKPAGPLTKPATTSTTASKPAVAKSTVAPTATKKPSVAPTKTTLSKTTAAAKPAAATTTAKPAAASTAAKQVPKQLSVSKTQTSTLKSPSKPTTPSSKPTTPTMPKSPSVTKTDTVKSPPKPAMRLTSAKPAGTTKSPGVADKPAEKKPMTNGESKPVLKKTEVPPKKPATSTAKPAPATRPTASAKATAPTKTTVSTTTTKAPLTKPAATTQAKPKPSAPAPIKRPLSSTTATKTTEKTGKDIVNKQISSTKPAVNGKTGPAKTIVGLKKTDTKVNGKAPTEKPVVKKLEEVKPEEVKAAQIQEDNVTTTNGFAEHIIDEHASMKIEELAPVIVDGVN